MGRYTRKWDRTGRKRPGPKALRAQRLKKNQSRLKFSISPEMFNLDWNFQPRPSEFPHKKKGFGGWLAWNFQSRLKFSSSWIFSIFVECTPKGAYGNTAFWEWFWEGSGKGSGEGVLRRVLRRGSSVGFTVRKGSEQGSQKGFWEGGFQKVPRTPPCRVRPLRRAPYFGPLGRGKNGPQNRKMTPNPILGYYFPISGRGPFSILRPVWSQYFLLWQGTLLANRKLLNRSIWCRLATASP